MAISGKPRAFGLGIFFLIVLSLVFGQGLHVSANKNLWGDEIYSYKTSVLGHSWKQIWMGQIRESNNSPLFYSVEKGWLGLTQFDRLDLPFWKMVWSRSGVDQPQGIWQTLVKRLFDALGREFIEGAARAGYPPEQAMVIVIQRLMLRAPFILAMAIAIAFLTTYFAWRCSFLIGFLALSLTLSSNGMWYFLAEARPYSMVILFAVLQLIFFWEALGDRGRNRYWVALGLVHWLMALTFALNVIPIGLLAIVAFFMKCRKVWFWVLGIICPLAILVIYYALSIREHFSAPVISEVTRIIFANVPWNRLLAFFVLPLLWWGWKKAERQPIEPREKIFIFWAWAILAAFAGVVLFYFLTRGMTGENGRIAPLSHRYAIYLSPLCIFVLVQVMAGAIAFARDIKAKLVVWSIVALVAVPELVKLALWLFNRSWPVYYSG